MGTSLTTWSRCAPTTFDFWRARRGAESEHLPSAPSLPPRCGVMAAVWACNLKTPGKPDNWVPFDELTRSALERAFQKDKTQRAAPFQRAKTGKPTLDYTADFLRMVQCSVKYKTERPLRREAGGDEVTEVLREARLAAHRSTPSAPPSSSARPLTPSAPPLTPLHETRWQRTTAAAAAAGASTKTMAGEARTRAAEVIQRAARGASRAAAPLRAAPAAAGEAMTRAASKTGQAAEATAAAARRKTGQAVIVVRADMSKAALKTRTAAAATSAAARAASRKAAAGAATAAGRAARAAKAAASRVAPTRPYPSVPTVPTPLLSQEFRIWGELAQRGGVQDELGVRRLFALRQPTIPGGGGKLVIEDGSLVCGMNAACLDRYVSSGKCLEEPTEAHKSKADTLLFHGARPHFIHFLGEVDL